MSELGRTIRAAREALNMTQPELGKHFGISKAAVNMWESGKNVPDQKKQAKLAEVLKLDPALVAALASGNPTPEPPALDPPPDDPSAIPTVQMTPVSLHQGPADVPVWASAQAGDDGAIILVPDPVDYVRRSERMQGVKNPFAFLIVGSSMSASLEHGDTVVINPALQPRPNVDCVFIHEQADGTYLALVKRLLRITPDHWKVRQFDPRRDFDLPKKKWTRAHVIAEIRRGGL